MAIRPRAEIANNFPVPQDRFIVIEQRFWVIQQELHHAAFWAIFLGPQNRITAYERLFLG